MIYGRRDEGGVPSRISPLGVVILDDSDEETPGPSNPVLHGDLGQGCSKDGGDVQDDDGGDYTNFYRLLGM